MKQVAKLTVISLRPFPCIPRSTNLWFCHYVLSPTLCTPVFPHRPVRCCPRIRLFLIHNFFLPDTASSTHIEGVRIFFYSLSRLENNKSATITCRRGHFWIRKEKVADSKIFGYECTRPWFHRYLENKVVWEFGDFRTIHRFLAEPSVFHGIFLNEYSVLCQKPIEFSDLPYLFEKCTAIMSYQRQGRNFPKWRMLVPLRRLNLPPQLLLLIGPKPVLLKRFNFNGHFYKLVVNPGRKNCFARAFFVMCPLQNNDVKLPNSAL